MRVLFLLLIAVFGTSEAGNAGFKRALVTLTFDDGHSCVYDNVLPLLKQHQIEATFYIDTAALGSPNRMDVQQIIELSQMGHEIGSHSHSHAHLDTLTSSEISRELAISKEHLEKILGKPVLHFAPPYGEANADVLALVKRYFQSSRSVKPGFNAKDKFNRFSIKVKSIRSTTRLSEVNNWLDAAKRHGYWLVLVYHQIDEFGELYSTTPKRFQFHLKAIQRHHLATATIGKALAEIMPQVSKRK